MSVYEDDLKVTSMSTEGTFYQDGHIFGNRTRDQYRDSLKIRRGNEELDTQWPRNKLHPLAMQVVHSYCKVTRPLRRKRVLHYKALYSKTIV